MTIHRRILRVHKIDIKRKAGNYVKFHVGVHLLATRTPIEVLHIYFSPKMSLIRLILGHVYAS